MSDPARVSPRPTPSRTRVLSVGFVLVAGLGVAFGHIGDRVILWPTTAPEDAGSATRMTFPLGTGELEVFRARSSAREPEAYILRFYGNADRPERWVAREAAQWSDRAVELWGVNYPGYGGSTGPARLEGVAAAALTAYDAVRRVAGTRPIFAFGTSLGTTAALHLAAERELGGVLLQNPPALRELIVGDHGWWNLWLVAYPVSRQIPAALDSVANAKRARCPAVFLLAENDEVVRPRYQHLVTDAYAGPKELLLQEGATHNTPMQPDFERKMRVAVGRMLGKRDGGIPPG